MVAPIARRETGGPLVVPVKRKKLPLVVGLFLMALGSVACMILAAAWVVGGRAAGDPENVQALLPPQPRESPRLVAPLDSSADEVPALQQSNDSGATDLLHMAAGATTGADTIPVEHLTELKAMGWVLPYLANQGVDVRTLQTAENAGERTVTLQMDYEGYAVTVSETRAEGESDSLTPLEEKISDLGQLDGVTTEELTLATGDEGSLFTHSETGAWGAVVDTGRTQYVITSEIPSDEAARLSSWVLNADRSRVELLPSSPGAGDRIGRGLDELVSWVGR